MISLMDVSAQNAAVDAVLALKQSARKKEIENASAVLMTKNTQKDCDSKVAKACRNQEPRNFMSPL